MPLHPDRRVAGLVLAAGALRRLGRPKQLLPYGDGVLLDAVLATARASGFDQIVLALGGAADRVRETADLHGVDVVENTAYGTGCSSSIAAAIPILHPDTDLLVLMLGDQPGVRPDTVEKLIAAGPIAAGPVVGRLTAERGERAITVCRYDDGIGHPFAFSRSIIPALSELHGDKAVWKLIDQRASEVAEVRIAGPIPLDVDTEADYERVLAALAGGS